jgi:hypothetical protein
MTSSRPSGGCGPPSVSSRLSRSSATTRGDDLAATQGELIEGQGWQTRGGWPLRSTARRALLVKAVTDPDWQAASQALDDLMRKLIVIHRLLEAEERLPKREPGPTRGNGGRPASV